MRANNRREQVIRYMMRRGGFIGAEAIAYHLGARLDETKLLLSGLQDHSDVVRNAAGKYKLNEAVHGS
jgi:hypothetical protein